MFFRSRTAKRFDFHESVIAGLIVTINGMDARIKKMETQMAKDKATLEAEIATIQGQSPDAVKAIVDTEIASYVAANVTPKLNDVNDLVSDVIDKLAAGDVAAATTSANAAQAAVTNLTSTTAAAAAPAGS